MLPAFETMDMMIDEKFLMQHDKEELLVKQKLLNENFETYGPMPGLNEELK